MYPASYYFNAQAEAYNIQNEAPMLYQIATYPNNPIAVEHGWNTT